MEINPLQSALAGLTAHAAKLAVAANNIANLNTPGFIRIQPGSTFLSSSNTPVISNPGGLPGSASVNMLSDVELAEELLNMKISKYGYTANARVISSHDEMIGTVLDIIT